MILDCTAPPPPLLLLSERCLYTIELNLIRLMWEWMSNFQMSHMDNRGPFLPHYAMWLLKPAFWRLWQQKSDQKIPVTQTQKQSRNVRSSNVFLFSMPALFLPACLTLQVSSLHDPAAVAPSGPCALVRDLIVWGRLRPVTWWSSDRAQVSLCALSELCTRDTHCFPKSQHARTEAKIGFFFVVFVLVCFKWVTQKRHHFLALRSPYFC